MLNDYKSTAQNRAAPKVSIMVISIQFTYIYVLCMYCLLFHETLIVNEAQVPPTGLLCEVQAGEMVTWKDFIILPIMQHYESVLCSSNLPLLDQKYRKLVILWNIITI